jgi:hypothetical protein
MMLFTTFEGEKKDAPPAVEMLMEAIDVVQQRRAKYGSPLDHWRRTVGMINAAFGEVLKRPLTPEEWGIIMEIDKIARYMGPGKTLDTPIDMAGYAACIAEVEATQ